MQKHFLKFFLIVSSVALVSCAGKKLSSDASYPTSDPREIRREQVGSLTGKGLKLFGKADDEGSSGAGVGIGVNSYLWRASLDSLSFMPLASTDPFGGVIATDWYEDQAAKGTRTKVNVVILDKNLRSDALKISVFKQDLKNGTWRDAAVSPKLATSIEDKILARARELKVAKEVGS